MLNTKCYVKTWYGFKYTLKEYSFRKLYAFKMEFYLSLLYITTNMCFIKEFIYIYGCKLCFYIIKRQNLSFFQVVWYQEKEVAINYIIKKQTGLRLNWSHIILFESLCYSIHGKIIKNINLSLYFWTNIVVLILFIKMNCPKYCSTLAQVKSENKQLRKNIQILKW